MTADGKVAIVTGAGTGIGRAIALQLGKAGLNVVVNYHRSQAEAERTALQIEESGSGCIVVKGDVSNDADCRRLVQEAENKWGRVDVLVNNAGFTRAAQVQDLDSVTEEDWDHTFGVNVKGPFFMARACAKHLREVRGCVVNVSSTAGMNSVGSSIAYAASKAALNNLTLALARALAPQVRVNAVLPGYVETRWNESTFGRSLDAIRTFVKNRTLLRGVAQPEHVAELACSLILGMSWVTGELIVADGGFLVGA